MSQNHRKPEHEETPGDGAKIDADRKLFSPWTNIEFALQGRFNSFVQSNSSNPTFDAYGRIQFAFDYFCEALFDGDLPHCVLTFVRRKKTLGYFGAELFASRDGQTAHEISLNSSYFAARSDLETLSTLASIMVDLHHHEYGPQNRRGGRGARGYHDEPWVMKMLSVGLHPTSDGTWSGKMTGYRLEHLIIDGGPFDRACKALLESGFQFAGTIGG